MESPFEPLSHHVNTCPGRKERVRTSTQGRHKEKKRPLFSKAMWSNTGLNQTRSHSIARKKADDSFQVYSNRGRNYPQLMIFSHLHSKATQAARFFPETLQYTKATKPDLPKIKWTFFSTESTHWNKCLRERSGERCSWKTTVARKSRSQQLDQFIKLLNNDFFPNCSCILYIFLNHIKISYRKALFHILSICSILYKKN